MEKYCKNDYYLEQLFQKYKKIFVKRINLIDIKRNTNFFFLSPLLQKSKRNVTLN